MRLPWVFLSTPLLVAQPASLVSHPKLIPTLWTQTAVEWQASCLQSYRTAQLMLDRARKSKSWTAAIEQTGNFRKLPPAIVLDIDETVLDNSPNQARQVRNGVGFQFAGWNQWVSEAKAGPIPGAVEFCRNAASRNVRVFFVTNREASQEPATRENLGRLGFPVDGAEDTILCRGEKPDWTSDKGTRRAAVAARYRILLMVGDDLGDFLSGVRAPIARRRELTEPFAAHWGTKWIILPNPGYGSWELALTEEKRPAIDLIDPRQ